jgi:signal peptide peptidase-like 3
MSSEAHDEHSTHWTAFFSILEPASVVLVATATATVITSAFRSLLHDAEPASHSTRDTTITLDARQAAVLPVFASAALLLLFYWFNAISSILLCLMCCSASVAFVFSIRPAANVCASGRPWLRRRLVFRGKTTSATVVDVGLAVAGGACVLTWLFTGSRILNNVIAVTLCMAFVSTVILPSLRLTTMLLACLLIYDVFWVFVSSRLFSGRNVMVEAALKQADNPAFHAAESLGLPSDGIARQLDLPTKFFMPYNLLDWSVNSPALLLGLGDVALPGMLAAMLLSNDVELWTRKSGRRRLSLFELFTDGAFWKQSYSLRCWTGYAGGVAAALGFGAVFRAAQPALLYIVPCCLLPVISTAWSRSELGVVWEGFERVEDDKEAEQRGSDVESVVNV